RGRSIIQQGEVGDTFYVIDEGVAVVTRLDPESGTQQHIRRLHEYSYFGERALLLSEPRSANVTADTKVRCLAISQKAFEQVLGPLQHIIDADRKRREQRPGVPPIGDLKLLGVVNEDDLGQMNLVKMPANSA
ncbi:cyclic nucleotide-binding-like protein, partial [Tribonema minus]